MAYCKKCGTTLKKVTDFCPLCGAPVGDSFKNSGEKENNNRAEESVKHDFLNNTGDISADYEDFNNDSADTTDNSGQSEIDNSYTRTEEFEKLGEKFFKLDKFFDFSFLTALFLPLFFIYFLVLFICNVILHCKAYKYLKDKPYSRMSKLINVNIWMFAVIIILLFAYGVTFEKDIFTDYILIELLIVSIPVYIIHSHITEICRQFRDKSPNTEYKIKSFISHFAEEHTLTGSFVSAIVFVYMFLIVVSNLVIFAVINCFKSEDSFTTKTLPGISFVKTQVELCLIQNGAMNHFAAGKGVLLDTPKNCRIRHKRTDSFEYSVDNDGTLRVSFGYPAETDYIITPLYTDNPERRFDWIASPMSGCAAKYNCLEADPNTF